MKTYTTKELKEIIEYEGEAQFILAEHFPGVERKFNRLTKQLAELLTEVQTVSLMQITILVAVVLNC